MEWKNRDAFICKAELPNTLENIHLCIYGLRSDDKGFMATCPIPEDEENRAYVYREVLRYLDSFLVAESEIPNLTDDQYLEMVEHNRKRLNGVPVPVEFLEERAAEVSPPDIVN